MVSTAGEDLSPSQKDRISLKKQKEVTLGF